jgi:hypothetical protein
LQSFIFFAFVSFFTSPWNILSTFADTTAANRMKYYQKDHCKDNEISPCKLLLSLKNDILPAL